MLFRLEFTFRITLITGFAKLTFQNQTRLKKPSGVLILFKNRRIFGLIFTIKTPVCVLNSINNNFTRVALGVMVQTCNCNL